MAWRWDRGEGVHRYVKARLLFLQKTLLNKAIYNCRFANLSQIFTIFGILVNNDIVYRSHDLGCYGTHFGGEICVTIVTKIGILLNWLAQAEYRVYNTGKPIPTAFQWWLGNCDIVYIKIIIGNLTAICQIITVELPIIILIYINSSNTIGMLKGSAFQWCITQCCTPCIQPAAVNLIIDPF